MSRADYHTITYLLYDFLLYDSQRVIHRFTNYFIKKIDK